MLFSLHLGVFILASENVSAQSPCFTYPDAIDPGSIQKATISLGDSLLDVFPDIRSDYRVIGYAKPDICSRRQILFSVFTKDVENNPYECRYGAFYSTSSGDYHDIAIKYTGKTKYFIKTQLYIKGQKMGELFFERRWVRLTR
jgi:hypothetical protein